MDLSLQITLIIVAAAIGALVTFIYWQKRYTRLQLEHAATSAALSQEQAQRENDRIAFSKIEEQIRHTFSTLSSDALQKNNEAFLKLARENLQQHTVAASKELEKREASIETLIKPIQQALEKTEKQIQDIEKDRHRSLGSLSEQLQHVVETQRQLQHETRNLVNALRRPEVRGRWGEMTLKRLAELSGMVERCDFYEQTSQTGEDGNVLRPDMIIRMPSDRIIIVDAKTSLDAYIQAIEATTDEARNQFLISHARKMRARVKELADKAYWSQFDPSPDFVVMFVPGDQFLVAALEQDHELMEDALRQRVVIATPTSIVALLRAIAFGWRQETLSENAEQIRKSGAELYSRLSTLTEHLGKLGKNLNGSVDHFNKVIGSLDRQILPSIRRFKEMGVETKKDLQDVDPIEHMTREVAETNE